MMRAELAARIEAIVRAGVETAAVAGRDLTMRAPRRLENG